MRAKYYKLILFRICLKRTATFLSAEDPRYELSYARDPSVRDTAIDIRKYTLSYNKI